jgi:hypothetical protein
LVTPTDISALLPLRLLARLSGDRFTPPIKFRTRNLGLAAVMP